MREHLKAGTTDGARLPKMARQQIAATLRQDLPNLIVYDRSGTSVSGGAVFAAREGEQRKLIACGGISGFVGETGHINCSPVTICDASQSNLERLRGAVPWLQPRLTADQPSLGLGDRLGLATPGHIAAAGESSLTLVLAQQSIREMTRTHRSAQQVMGDAVFGVFETGYDHGFGSDADHLKTKEDVDVTAKAGFTSFTIDPSDHVDDAVEQITKEECELRFQRMVDDGVPGAGGWRGEYVGRSFTVGELTVSFDEEALVKAAVKYGRAVAHSVMLASYIGETVPEAEIELSVDETEEPTSVVEHLFIAREMQRRGIRLASVAPRFVGAFEKGIDYKGDLVEFEDRLKDHMEIAKHLGRYKISVHSGSDKFDVYPIVARVTGGRFHLKTAGTSYLEGLRVVARHDRVLFREIVRFCRERFETDRATYHISAELNSVPDVRDLSDGDLERTYLDEDGGRQILHVTFGSVLTVAENGRYVFRNQLLGLVNREASTYVQVLSHHIGRHVLGLQGFVMPVDSLN